MHYEYDILGRISRSFSTEGIEVRYRYDCLDRLEQICYRNGIKTSYRYDAVGNGNRLSKTGTQGPATDGSSALDITYQYDVRGQLLEEKWKACAMR